MKGNWQLAGKDKNSTTIIKAVEVWTNARIETVKIKIIEKESFKLIDKIIELLNDNKVLLFDRFGEYKVVDKTADYNRDIELIQLSKILLIPSILESTDAHTLFNFA